MDFWVSLGREHFENPDVPVALCPELVVMVMVVVVMDAATPHTQKTCRETRDC